MKRIGYSSRFMPRGHPCAIESLESRVLWAANLVPNTIAGLVLQLNVGSAKAQFSASATSATYQMSGALSGSGTYSFVRNTPTVATLRTVETGDNLATTATLTFSSRTAGTYKVVSGGGDVSAGAFSIVGTVQPQATLSGNVLSVGGTFSDDQLSIVTSGGTIYVSRNNWTTTYSASSVKSINVALGDGKDFLAVGAGVMGIYCDAGTGNDNLVGGSGKDTLTGGAGKDTLDGGASDDRLNGSGGHDSLVGSDGADRLYGGDGNDTCVGGGQVDRAWGGTGDDLLVGGSSNDKLYGESGDDQLIGNKGSDLLNGGDGTDTCDNDPLDTEFEMED